ncbi:MAG: hypothetical protein HKN47_05325 [Pirellulaceae bacterium]|nr:hypothetical protein [Pirellulaceae bacterium]
MTQLSDRDYVVGATELKCDPQNDPATRGAPHIQVVPNGRRDAEIDSEFRGFCAYSRWNNVSCLPPTFRCTTPFTT